MFYVPTASRPPLGVVFFIAPAHVFYHKKTRQKAVEKKIKKQSRPTKTKLGQKLQKIPSKNQFKIHNNNPKNGAAPKAPPHFWGGRRRRPRCCFEFCIGFLWEFSGASGPAFFLAWIFSWLFSRRLFDEFFVIKNMGRRNKKYHRWYFCGIN